ncbi:MAG TPA: hypothetical protein VFD58_27635 [Blastocatellia bacterium]|nr:hypothetical protein [Blastocatellia bacterium]
MLNEKFVCLASDCDRPEPEVMAIGRENMPYARTLPFILFLDSDGKFVHGTAGGTTAFGFKADLEEALARR